MTEPFGFSSSACERGPVRVALRLVREAAIDARRLEHIPAATTSGGPPSGGLVAFRAYGYLPRLMIRTMISEMAK